MSTTEQPRKFDIIQRRRYVLVAERMSEGGNDRTARWFFDKADGRWFTAESWNRPNRKHPLSQKQAEYVAGMILGG